MVSRLEWGFLFHITFASNSAFLFFVCFLGGVYALMIFSNVTYVSSALAIKVVHTANPVSLTVSQTSQKRVVW